MHPEFSSLTNTAGLELVDPIETRRFTLRTDAPVEPTPAGTAAFAFPVDGACEVRATTLTLPYTVPVNVRAPDGTHLASVCPPTTREFAAAEYLLELHAPMKVYLRAAGPFEVRADTDRVRFDFETETAVRVGARSYHAAPADTVTVPDDPEAAMRAVSTFASSLKTTSPERSWPTMRGHPPSVERGDELSIPAGLDAPRTGIEISVPPEYGPVYAVAPLAFYLGAAVVPGAEALVTAEDVSYPLGDDTPAIADGVERLLKRTFMLDCVTRTEGYYPIDLHERTVLESRPDVRLDFAALYEASPADRLDAYLGVPEAAVETLAPTWHRVTHVQTAPETVELLPYVVNDLSLVRPKRSGDSTWTPTESQRRTENALAAFVRGDGRQGFGDDRNGFGDDRNGFGDDRDDSGNDATVARRGVPSAGEYVPLPETDALERAWVGDRTPERGAKLLLEAFANETPEPTDGVIDIAVVCNDERMQAEWDAVGEIYGSRDDVFVDVECRFDVPTDDLRDVLAEDSDVFHFVGHIDGLGFECPDGILDAETVAETGATTVLLNGCRSHDQGVALVEAGANAAVVSLGDVGNEGAAEVGETLARLLHYGFSVGSAMTLVREYTSIGRDYVVLGDPGVEVAQCESGVPILYRVSDADAGGARGDSLTVEPLVYPTRTRSLGTAFLSYLPETESHHVAFGSCGAKTLSPDEFRRTLSGDSMPVIIDEKLTWSDCE